MSSYGDSIKLKVKEFEKTDRDTEFILPEIYYNLAFEEYYPQVDFSWQDEGVEIKNCQTTIIFQMHRYEAIPALMENLEEILVDGRHAPYEGCFKGHYLLSKAFPVCSFFTKLIDNETGNVLYEKEIDEVPNIVHDVHKYEQEHLKDIQLISNKEKVIELIGVHPAFYSLADSSLKEDEELALFAVKEDGENYAYLLDKYQRRKDFQLTAFVSNPASFHMLPKETQEDYGFLLEACSKSWRCLFMVNNRTYRRRIIKDVREKYFKEIPAEEFNYIKEMWGRDSF